MNNFAKSYLTMQGVYIYPPARVASKQVETREKEMVPVVPQCERGDL
jgi:hypothetical protein